MITKIEWNYEWKFTISPDNCPESPREWAEGNYLCIREHRRYDFPNELDVTEEGFENSDFIEWLAESKNLKVFWLDCYEHSSIRFSIAGTGRQCQFDTANKCGFILAEDIEQAEALIEEYNQYLNWEVYSFSVSKRKAIELDWEMLYGEWDYVDGSYGFYDTKNIVENCDLYVFTKEEIENCEITY